MVTMATTTTIFKIKNPFFEKKLAHDLRFVGSYSDGVLFSDFVTNR